MGKSLLTDDLLREIRLLINQGLTVREVSEKLGHNIQRIYNWCRDNNIDYLSQKRNVEILPLTDFQRSIVRNKYGIEIPTDIDEELQVEFYETIRELGKEYALSWYKEMKNERNYV